MEARVMKVLVVMFLLMRLLLILMLLLLQLLLIIETRWIEAGMSSLICVAVERHKRLLVLVGLGSHVGELVGIVSRRAREATERSVRRRPETCAPGA